MYTTFKESLNILFHLVQMLQICLKDAYQLEVFEVNIRGSRFFFQGRPDSYLSLPMGGGGQGIILVILLCSLKKIEFYRGVRTP